MSGRSPYTLNTDGPTRALAGALLPAVQALNPAMTSTDMFMGAVRVGLNRLCSSRRPITLLYLTEESALDVLSESRLINDADAARAAVLAAAYSVTTIRVLSAAARTGMALLAGMDTLLRPPV